MAFVCEEPHIMAVYNFASTVAFDFGFDRAKEMIVSYSLTLLSTLY